MPEGGSAAFEQLLNPHMPRSKISAF
jgi:hypothetical protein